MWHWMLYILILYDIDRYKLVGALKESFKPAICHPIGDCYPMPVGSFKSRASILVLTVKPFDLK